MGLLAREDEIPLADILDRPGWRENYCFEGYDAESDIGFHIHIGRWWADPRIWRELVLLFMPGGLMLAHYGWGAGDSRNGPAGALLKLHCDKPGEEWMLHYRGPVQTVSASELAQGPVAENVRSLVDFEVRFSSAEPVWDFGAVKGETWAASHIEQVGRVDGMVHHEGQSVALRGFGFRDHSRGPRDLSNMHGHCWIHGVFADGKSFALLDVRRDDGQNVARFSKAVIWDKGTLHDAVCPDMPYPQSPGQSPGDYMLTLDSDLGSMKITAKIGRSMPFSATTKMDWLNGVAYGRGHFVTFLQTLTLSWDGLHGIGLGERSILL